LKCAGIVTFFSSFETILRVSVTFRGFFMRILKHKNLRF
jgi:hypothetical protein